MPIKPLDEATTPEEMRAALFKMSYDDSLVGQVFMHANRSGLSAEDRYTMLAYHAVKAYRHMMNDAIEQANISPRHYTIFPNQEPTT